VPDWIWNAVGAFVSGGFLYLFSRANKVAEKKRSELSRKIDDNTLLTAKVDWKVSTLVEYVNKQNGRIGKLEDRVWSKD
jgi:hypothetical protein